MILENRSDRALLFSRTGYRGKVEIVAGPRRITDFRDAFFPKLRAIRISPFRLHLNVTVVHKGDNNPGSWTSRTEATTSVNAAIQLANTIWDQGMLRFERRRRVHFRESFNKFDLAPPFTAIPTRWKRRGLVDMVVVNCIGTGGIAGQGKPPMFGNTVVIPRRAGLDKTDLTDEQMGYAFAHELGHYLGIHHASAHKRQTNLMFPALPATITPASVQLTSNQVEQVHGTLASNISRKGDRH